MATKRENALDLTTDLVPVSTLNEGPMVVVVRASSEIKSPADLVAAAHARPDQLTFGSSGVGTLVHLYFEMVNDAAEIKLKHIPYKGASFVTADLVGGRIDMTVGAYSAYASQIKAGRLRAIAVTSRQPSAAFPDLPTMSSAMPAFSVDTFATVFATAGTPVPILERLNRELNGVAMSKEIRQLSQGDGLVPMDLTLPELRTRIRENVASWKKLAADKQIVID